MIFLASILPHLHLHLHLGRHVAHWLERWGYAALFGSLFSCGFIPLPEDVPLLTAGVFVGQGKMNLALAAVCAWLGIMCGDIALYHLGKFFGMEVQKIPVVGRHVSVQRVAKIHAMFEKWGVWVIAVGRMFAGVRGTVVVVAGAIRFTFWKFLLADGLAACVSGGSFLMLGYWFGSNKMLRHYVEEGKQWALIGVLILAGGLGIWIYINQMRRRRRGSAAAEPGQPPIPPPAPASNSAAE